MVICSAAKIGPIRRAGRTLSLAPASSAWIGGMLVALARMSWSVVFAGAAGAELSVESQVTWASPAMPEVHLLLRNTGTEARDFVAELGAAKLGERFPCTSSSEESFARRFSRWDGASRGISRGTIAAGAWTHRSMTLGTLGALPPCALPFRVSSRSGEREPVEIVGTIEVPEAPRATSDREELPTLRWKAVVEVDRTYDRRLLARVLVTNESQSATRVLVTRREIVCSRNADVRVALHEGVLQGHDVGPFDLHADGWAVFLTALYAPDAATAGACTLRLEISAETASGVARAISTDVRLAPSGYVSGVGD